MSTDNKHKRVRNSRTPLSEYATFVPNPTHSITEKKKRTCEKVIDDDYIVTFLHEPVYQMRANESGAACHENAFVRRWTIGCMLSAPFSQPVEMRLPWIPRHRRRVIIGQKTVALAPEHFHFVPMPPTEWECFGARSVMAI